MVVAVAVVDVTVVVVVVASAAQEDRFVVVVVEEHLSVGTAVADKGDLVEFEEVDIEDGNIVVVDLEEVVVADCNLKIVDTIAVDEGEGEEEASYRDGQ